MTPRPRARRISVAYTLAILALVAFGPGHVHGQATSQATSSSPRGGVRLGTGIARHGQTDLMASPLRYRGTGLQGVLGYRAAGDATRFEVAGAFSALGLESGISDNGSREDLYFGTLRVQWLRRVGEGLRWEGFLGARLDALIPFRVHTYPPDGQTELFGDLFAPIHVVAAHELRLSPRMVAWQALAVPVAAVVLRSPYTGLKYVPDVSVEPPGRLMGFDHVLGIDRALTSRWSWVAEWRLTVLRYPDPRELTLVTHRWELGLEVRP